ncbi:MAG: PIN domain-containing protein [Candidatus Micrarchaeota archaeon]|nr:PIN domain-containing protein [Candidatus Micrarchaeota archaeon]
MNKTIFIDTSVFILAYTFPTSNSAMIEKLIDGEEITGVISGFVLEELNSYFRKYQNEKIVYKVLKHVSTMCEIVYRDNITLELEQWKGKIKEKDLEHLATVKYLGLRYLIAYDRDYEPFEEYRTPKQFIRELGLKSYQTEY